jgi:hypothetical protein
MLRLLGVTKIVVHNSTIGQAASKVLHHYEKAGLIDVRQTRPLVDPADKHISDKRLRDSIALSDCMYRNMYIIDYILVIDFDEIIVPQRTYNYSEMIVEIKSSLNKSYWQSYQFLNVYFLMEREAADLSQPAYSTFMRYRRRLAPSRPGWHIKSIINPRVCAFVFNHYCLYGINHFKVCINSLFMHPH